MKTAIKYCFIIILLCVLGVSWPKTNASEFQDSSLEGEKDRNAEVVTVEQVTTSEETSTTLCATKPLQNLAFIAASSLFSPALDSFKKQKEGEVKEMVVNCSLWPPRCDCQCISYCAEATHSCLDQCGNNAGCLMRCLREDVQCTDHCCGWSSPDDPIPF